MPQSLVIGAQGAKRQRSTDGRLIEAAEQSSLQDETKGKSIIGGRIQNSNVRIPPYLEKSRSEILSTFQEVEWKQRFRLFHAMQNPQNSPYKVDRSEVVVNRNRYGNVQPWDASRIKLKNPIAGSDYVNASPILLRSRSVDSQTKDMKYIATQGPKSGQASHFWHMVHQEVMGNTGVIIMLTQLFEDNKEKCGQYYPLDFESPTMTLRHEEEQVPALHGNGNSCPTTLSSAGTNEFQDNEHFENIKDDVRNRTAETVDTITLIEKEFDESVGCEVRKMTLTINNESKNIIHYLFGRWPDFGKPDVDDRKALIEMSRRSYVEAGDSPRIAHCSAGVGRTGTWIALDFLVREVEEGRLLDSVKTPRSGVDKISDQVQSQSPKTETWGRSGPSKVMTPTSEEGFDKDEQDLIFDTVNTLREQRMMMVIRDVQFSFLYDVVREAVLEKYRTRPEGAVVKEGDQDLRPRRSKQPRISDEYASSESASEAETEIMDVDGQITGNDDDPYSAVSPDVLRRGISQEFGADK